MLPNWRVVLYAVLLVGGLWWCKEIFGRLGSDITRLRESDDAAEKGVTLGLWAVTGVIIYLIARLGIALARGILSAF